MTSTSLSLVEVRPRPGAGAVLAVAHHARRAVGSRNNYGVAALAVGAFVLIAALVLRGGYASPDIAAMLGHRAGLATGGWLTEVVLFFVRAVHGAGGQHTALALLPAVATGLLFAILYHNVRDSDWSVPGAGLLLVLFGAHALVLYSITSAVLVIPTLIAMGALIPAIRRLESVGDVQADVSFGLVLPLLLLAGPQTTPLIVPLAIASAFANPDGRSNRGAFVAMLLVAVMPTLIVMVAIAGFAAAAGVDLADLIVPYANAYGHLQFSGLWAGLLDVVALAPVAAIPIVYCFFADRRRRRWSALAVVGLPLYLAIGNAIFPWHLPLWTPAMTLLVCFACWLAVARVRAAFRIAALALLAVSALASWLIAGVLNDPAWTTALVTAL